MLKNKVITNIIIAISLTTLSFAHAQTSKQDNIINEIITTEKSYNNGLIYLKDFLESITKNPGLKNNIPIKDAAHSALNYIAPILEISNQVLSALDKDKTINGVANTMKKFTPYFKVYAPYAADYLKIVKPLSDKNNSNMKALETALWSKAKLDSGNLLITPIQRVPRYKLLLGELLKTDPKNASLEGVISSLTAMNLYIDKFKW